MLVERLRQLFDKPDDDVDVLVRADLRKQRHVHLDTRRRIDIEFGRPNRAYGNGLDSSRDVDVEWLGWYSFAVEHIVTLTTDAKVCVLLCFAQFGEQWL